ncbi:hypothetical protein NDU88_000454 [Pleurodeles waltl]|uniref:Uncharacterized protein n=1 Tax=Pleurodeles waltl TaxID=8319 RepID=A0AAV7N852_PLEWA|nr:hypothetical protein NDU88_000454 [Pleurodeles waltl]
MRVVTGRLAAVERPPYRVFSSYASRLIPQPGAVELRSRIGTKSGMKKGLVEQEVEVSEFDIEMDQNVS